MTEPIFILRWPTGGAEIDLRAWFPASQEQLSHLRKLIRLDPEQGPAIVKASLECIRNLQEAKQGERDASVETASRFRSAAACNESRSEAARLRSRAEQFARNARRAERDIRTLQRNAASIRSWEAQP